MKQKVLLFLAATLSYMALWWILVYAVTQYFSVSLGRSDVLLFFTVYSPLIVIPARWLSLKIFWLFGDDDAQVPLWDMFASPRRAFNFYWEQSLACVGVAFIIAVLLVCTAIGGVYYFIVGTIKATVWLAKLAQRPPVWWLLLSALPYVAAYVFILSLFWPQLLEPDKFWFHLLFISIFGLSAWCFRQIKYEIYSFFNYAYKKPDIMALFSTPQKAVAFWGINLLFGPFALVSMLITLVIIGATIIKELFNKKTLIQTELSKG